MNTNDWQSVTRSTMPPDAVESDNIEIELSPGGSVITCCGHCVARYVALYGYPEWRWRLL